MEDVIHRSCLACASADRPFYLPLDILKLFDSLQSVASYVEGAVLFDQGNLGATFLCPVEAATRCPKNAPPKLAGNAFALGVEHYQPRLRTCEEDSGNS